ncbi:hypothetical protein [Butyrivibrio fibrisolvens]|uniref:hypothetical protein n=1 Tax=Butyrivibrio fibrisolvens TaxID=831 RepID=UPI0003B4C7EA|nr:hypothetical protein [Butyrivibrio fibrisolvens]
MTTFDYIVDVIILLFLILIIDEYYELRDKYKAKMNFVKAKYDVKKLIDLYKNDSPINEILRVAHQMEDESSQQGIRRSVYLRCEKGNFVETEVFTAIILCLASFYVYGNSIVDTEDVIQLAHAIYDETEYKRIVAYKDLIWKCSGFCYWSSYSKLSGSKKHNGDKVLSELTYSYLRGGHGPQLLKDIENN